MSDTKVVIIVETARVDEIRTMAASFTGGANMFITPVCHVDNESEITHYISAGFIDSEVYSMFDNLEQFSQVLSAKMGIEVSDEFLSAIKSTMHFSQDDPRNMLASLSLKVYTVNEELIT